MFSPFRISYHFWIPNFFSGNNGIQHYTLWRNKINMNVWLDITSEVFKGGRQIYIQMKAYVLPFKNIISFLNLAYPFIP